MNRIVAALFLMLSLWSNGAPASEFCTNGHFGAYTCFPTLEQAEAYMYAGSLPYSYTDADPALLKPLNPILSTTPSGVPVKLYRYWYGNLAPKIDFGPKWTNSCGQPGCGGLYDSEGEAFDAAKQVLVDAGVASKPLYLRSSSPAQDYVLRDFLRYQTISGSYREGTTQELGNKHYCTYEGTAGAGDYCIVVVGRHRYACPDTHKVHPRRVSLSQMSEACQHFALQIHIEAENEPFKSADNCSVGNPCHPLSGSKVQEEVDFEWNGLLIGRTFNSSAETQDATVFGRGWASTFEYALTYVPMPSPQNGYFLTNNGKHEYFRTDTTSGFGYSLNQPGSRLKRYPDDTLILERPDGKKIKFARLWINNFLAYAAVSIEDSRTGLAFQLEYCTDAQVSDCGAGRIKSITSSQGRSLTFSYANVAGELGEPVGVRLNSIAADGKVRVSYGYNALGLLKDVSYPSSTGVARSFRYNESARTCVSASGANLTPCYVTNRRVLLTAIYDESGKEYGIYKYDNYGRVVSSEHPGSAGKVTLTYPSATSTQVTSPNGALTTYSAVASNFFGKLAGVTTGAITASKTYDSKGYLDRETDRNGVQTDHNFNSLGQRLQVTRGVGTAQQQIETTTWDAATNRPSVTDRQGQRVSHVYNARGQVLTATVTDLTIEPNLSRVTTYRYCEQADIDLGLCPLAGQMLSVDGPRVDVSDVTTYEYYLSDEAQCASSPTNCLYRKGDLRRITNAAGHSTSFLAYDSDGRAFAFMDAHNVGIDLEYSTRGWLVARKVRGLDNNSEADDAITRLDYDDIGQVIKVTQPDGVYTAFTYDDAHRLTDITDALGNKIHFTLDNAGNRLKEETRDGSGALKRALSRVYNTLGQLQTLKDANLAATSFTYDGNGDTNTVTDPLGRVTDNNVDPLGRLSQVIANVNRKGLDQATTKYQFDERDNLTAVVDPKGLTTAYAYNGFNELVQLSSSDTAGTAYTYDSAGNPFSQTDARGILMTYNHDALNRLTGISLPTFSQNVQFDYDAPPADCQVGEIYGAGRLAQMQDESGSTRYCYDLRGNLVRKVQGVAGGSTLTVGSTYNGAGRLSAMTYPSGAVVVFLRNANGQVQRIDASPSAGSAQIALVSSVSYLPFGPLTSLTFGSGRSLTKTFDQNYGIDLVSDSVATGLREDFTLNAAGNVTALTERVTGTSSVTRGFGYDGLDRLITHKQGTKTVVEAFKYDATGNRTAKTVGATTTAYSYPTTNHRLTSVGATPRSYDVAGNTESIGTGAAARGFEFDDRGRLRNFKLGTTVKATYRYNGKGERVLRLDAANPANSQQFIYDEAGRLLGEYTTTGGRVKEYVWLDDTLVAILGDHDGGTHLYVETDHLGSPRAVVHPVKNTIVWRWDINNSTFGDHAPSVDPDGNGQSYSLNLRYPGQYYDAESGLSYNLNRYFDNATGRYIESDPIGLAGGMSTYAYVNGNPLSWIDPDGLDGIRVDPNAMHAQGAQHAQAMQAMSTAFSMLSGYASEMKRKNIPGVDQFYHCLGACSATQATGDKQMVLDLMATKESVDFWRNRLGLYGRKKRPDDEMLADMAGDIAVNQYGAGCGPNENCVKRCSRYLDLIPTSRRPEMSEYRQWK